MVIGPVVKELVKFGIRYGRRYYNLESKAFNKLYTGFPRSRTIGRGVRHGLTVGSVTGSLIAPDSPGNDDALQKRIPVSNTPRTPYKTRYGQSNRSGSQQSRNRYPDKYGRCPSPRFRKPMRNRF